jgi:hypothetical protein
VNTEPPDIRELGGRAALFHQSIVEIHQLPVVVVLQEKLSWTDLGLLAQQHLRAEVTLQVFQS